VGFEGCIPETVTQDGVKLTYGRVDFVYMGANLIVSTECQEHHHKGKGYGIGCEVARSSRQWG
jgi:hypothetical protein